MATPVSTIAFWVVVGVLCFFALMKFIDFWKKLGLKFRWSEGKEAKENLNPPTKTVNNKGDEYL